MTPYYEKDGITIYHGDCREIVPQLQERSIDLLLTDPPYFLPAHHHATRDGTSRSFGNLSILEHFFRDTFKECLRVMNRSAFAYVFCDGQSYPIMFKAGYSIFHRIRPLVWDKGNSINGYSWRHQHELILFATLEGSPQVKTGDGDVICMSPVPIGERTHDAEKPVALLERLIKKSAFRQHSSKKADAVVLDPFMGSGSTLVAAKGSGRQAIGIEIEEKYCEIAVKRLRQGVLNLTA